MMPDGPIQRRHKSTGRHCCRGPHWNKQNDETMASVWFRLKYFYTSGNFA